MKKVFHIWLSLLLLVSTAGLSVSKHICGDTVIDIAILQQANSCHGDAGMEMPGCCEDETSHFQVEDDFQLEKSLELKYPAEYLVYTLSFLILNQAQKNNISKYFSDHSPPPISGTDIRKKVQSFLL
jgi:hypothetical protein